MARRMRLVLPRNWFGETTPVLDGMLAGLGVALAGVYTLIQGVQGQARLVSASGTFIDSFAADFLGTTLLRWSGEDDADFRQRVGEELLRDRGTRGAVELALTQLTGRAPSLFEPARTTDTGGYCIGGTGYGLAGGWGSLALPYQFFVTLLRPQEAGIALLAGYGTGGFSAYGDLAMTSSGPTDAVLMQAIPLLLPAGTIAWCRISN
jgi:hypothetical protein